MSLDIDWSTIFKVTFVFVAGVYLKPLVMVSRDWLVWLYIDRRLVTAKLYKDIDENAHQKLLYYYKHMLLMHLESDLQNQKYTYTSKQHDNKYTLDRRTIDTIIKDGRNSEAVLRSQQIRLAKASSKYDSLIKHYDQDKPNPIEDALQQASQKYSIENPETKDPAILSILQDYVQLGVLDTIEAASIKFN